MFSFCLRKFTGAPFRVFLCVGVFVLWCIFAVIVCAQMLNLSCHLLNLLSLVKRCAKVRKPCIGAALQCFVA